MVPPTPLRGPLSMPLARPAPEDNAEPNMAKPLRCRLRLHASEDRENPETHGRYQVCVRCNAYRDKGGARPDDGAATASGFVIGGP
jgi:hypothetical protein